ncbi:hypothetical protein HOF46_02685 [Candidatus Woesearchaeota archaeon]|jgi:hypothetical protein|nr:hypothetical protein [Candidatus Woesearchaeota archaeon]MBT4114213.1 hypothetical protein [Candidatus Woesearchaeota archaeon]
MGFTDFVGEILGIIFLAFMLMLIFGWIGLVLVAIAGFVYLKWFRRPRFRTIQTTRVIHRPARGTKRGGRRRPKRRSSGHSRRRSSRRRRR